MKVIQKLGIAYSLPTAEILHATPLGVSELAGRTAYNSFDKSEHDVIRNFTIERTDELDIGSSTILDDLSWTFFHHSVLEHVSINYRLTTSRGVLHELMRHRIASPTVQSTRYTMSNVIYAFAACQLAEDNIEAFIDLMLPLDLFVTTDKQYNILQIEDIYNKLTYQLGRKDKYTFFSAVLSKDNLEYLRHVEESDTPEVVFRNLQAGKQKRNAGDPIKHIVNDNWRVNLILTFNLRSLKNFFYLRRAGSAFFLIDELAKAMIEATPSKYLKLIRKDN